MTWQADYAFYQEVFRGGMEEAEFAGAAARAEDVLRGYERAYRVTGSAEDRARAVCALAECIAYFDAAQNGEGGLRYAKVGSVSVSGKGIYSQVDISPKAQEKELYRTAGRYLEIYLGTGLCGHRPLQSECRGG